MRGLIGAYGYNMKVLMGSLIVKNEYKPFI